MLYDNYDYTTCTVANSLNVTRFVSSGPGDCPPLVLITGFKGCRGFAVNNPAEVASSLSFCDSPLCGLFGGGAMTCGNWLGVMYLLKNKSEQKLATWHLRNNKILKLSIKYKNKTILLYIINVIA